MATPIFALADEYIDASARLNPMWAGAVGVTGDFGTATDFGPDAEAERARLNRDTLARLRALDPTGPDDDLAKRHMEERLAVLVDRHEAGEWRRSLQVPFGIFQSLVGYVDVAPRSGEDDWALNAARMRAIPEMLGTWRQAMDAGIEAGQTASARQAAEGAKQARRTAESRVFDKHLQAYGEGPLAAELRAAADAAYAGYADAAAYLEQRYLPHADPADGVGEERYLLAARYTLGSRLDPRDAYEWGWEELHRIEEEMAAEAAKILPGASLDEVTEHLNATRSLDTHEAFLAWLQEKHRGALEALDGVHFDIHPRLMDLDVQLVHGSSSGAPYYTGPSEDLTRPGRTWWPVSDGERFGTWDELTTVFHEGVPGHHLQVGQTRVAGDRLSRFTRLFGSVSGHSEGWALYAERLCDELGWFTETGSRLGMLGGSAMRAARVVIDIGWHLGYPLPDAEAERHGREWSFDTALDVLTTRGRVPAHRARPEIVRYQGWPAQAICYKLGERAWVAARDEAKAAAGAGFDLKAWHTAALDLGPMGLDNLAAVLRK
ncbi:DUF885 domain-containing protein [Glycomyces terrestris]|uniref:DUF885 domain-containing protein n=1 Tax=Glycomyces terrestris TaxID=2493553 RepID=A0A426UXD0_9ACTN|nr:DUF885 domain-containing protein [Glycomyces terrestris]RRR99140.1 DUF885 domain-containing protein [Glycomyces terrestris]